MIALSKIKAAVFLILPFILSLETQALPQINPAHVRAIRHRSGPNYTRVVIDLDRKAQYSWRLLEKDPSIGKPRRLYVDIKDAKLPGDIKTEIPVNDLFLKGIRAGQHDGSTVRIVLDIESIGDYEVFPLSNPFRVVIDVRGEGSKSSKKEPAGEAKVEGGHESILTKSSVKTIVIDPGHGGKDPGAIGKNGLKEKDVTLKVSKLLRDKLKGEGASRIILTRESDVYIPLDERTAIANSKEADLFISVHVNASPRRAAAGVETYYLGSTGDKEAIRVAARENDSSEEEMNDTLRYILRDLERTGNQEASIRLAAAVQTSLSSALNGENGDTKNNRGIKGALFYVLVNSNMPSVLVEVSYITNPAEEERMRSAKFLEDISEGISAGVLEYLKGEGAP
ncbi:MAG: N-acetylmuramoyl-L-alanine amidase [Deltaproteobacteria bacterium]|nr:N-acetylmuramoyl-L-alanine amidase [Deltaproteobacteria bacterium]